MRWKNVVTVLLLSSLSATGYAKTDGDPWAQTKVDFTLVEYFTRKVYPCNKNEQNQLACIELVNGFGAALKPQQMLIAKGSDALYTDGKIKAIQDVGPLQLVSYEADTNPDAKKDVSSLEVNKLNKSRLASITQAAKDSFKTQANYNFEALARQLYGQYTPDPKDKVSTQAIIAGSVTRMMEVIDGHSHLDPIAAIREDNRDADTKLIGIGAQIRPVPTGTLVDNVFEQSPAEKSGIRDGDIIVTVDDQPTKGLPSQVVVDRIRGIAGTTVHLKVDRKGQTIPIDVVRAPVTMKNVDEKIVTDMGMKIARIRLGNFMDDKACGKISEILTSLPDDVGGVILDLRDDGGGQLDQALCIGGLFVGQLPITLVREVRSGVTLPEKHVLFSDQDLVTKLPMVVLVNNMSASASELVSGALQDYQRAYIMGTTTFGKGSVQQPQVLPLFDKSIFWFQTVERFYQPADHTNQQVGIQPDFVVYPRPNMTDEEKFQPREGDLVPSALGAIGKPWVQPRPREIASLQSSCLGTKRAEAMYNAKNEDQAATGRNDYQLYSAEELLSCIAGGKDLN